MAVNEYFSAMRADGKFIDAKQAAYSMKTMRHIYFGMTANFTPEEILHEVLHMFTGGDDNALARRLGVTIPADGNTDVITVALRNGGCRE